MINIFGSMTKVQEIWYLLDNLKKVVRQGFYDYELKKVEKFCNENKLYLVKSKNKILLKDKGFSNKGIIVNSKQKNALTFVYISKNEKDAYLACYFETIGDHDKFGEILGYPKCCRDFFLKNFSENNTNPQIKSKNIFTNISKRDKDLVIISHFPCNENCSKSISLGKKFLTCIEKYDQKRSLILLNSLTLNFFL